MKKLVGLIVLAGAMGIFGPAVWAADEAPKAKEVAPAVSKAFPSGAPVSLDKVEIWVGNEIITTADIEEPLKQFRENFSQTLHGPELEKKMDETRTMHLERLIESKLLLLEAREQKLELQDTMIDQQVDKEIESAKAQFPTHEAYLEQLAKEHMTEAEFRKQREAMVREGLLRQRLLQDKVQEFKTGVEVSDEQLQDYYTKHHDKFMKPARAHVLQIFVDRPDTGLSSTDFNRAYQAAKEKIRRALAEINAGKSFADVARRYSEHKLTADKGGDIGWIEEGDIDLKEFNQAVFKQLQPGQHSDVLDTARGFFILKLEDRQQGGELPLAEVRGRIRMEMMSEGSEMRYKAWVETLKKKFPVRYASEKYNEAAGR